MNVGVFLARMQPLHNGHLALIKKILEENDKALILIGSSDKLNSRNPIPGTTKPFFNILLDDRAGLGSAYRSLKLLVNSIK